MTGLLFHLIAGSISAAIVYRKFKKPQYSAAIFIGNFLHDVFVVAYIPFLIGTLNPTKILSSPYFYHRDTYFNLLWMVIQSIFVITFLFFQKYIRKKEFKEFEYNVGFLLLGIVTHAMMDIAIQETGIWI